ncbi:MAG: alpha-amylase family glycosyl hydrolase [Myxococcota bacterium]|nr:alpha-amylase family glycosyl hydrolase [Myxococcota bacterium]
MRRVALILAGMGCSDPDSSPPKDGLDDATDGLCPTEFRYTAADAIDGIAIVGPFNNWDPSRNAMERVGENEWRVSVPLEPGAHPYMFTELIDWTYDQAELAVCDPNAGLALCEYTTAYENDWDQECSTESSDCASMIVVPDCSQPAATIDGLTHAEGTLTITGTVTAGAFPIDSVELTINGVAQDVAVEDGTFHVEHTAEPNARHHIVVSATDTEGTRSAPAVAPIWTDEFEWPDAVIYHALIDRVANGNPDNDATADTTHAISDWAGGDLAGLEASLPFLDDLGVNTLWLSNPQPAPPDAWPGDCNATYSGYHGFWPASYDGVDAHLGDTAALDSLIGAAHERGMRVIMDWVGNHVHDDHAAASDDERFHPTAVCNDRGGDGVSNWDRIPEECWFTNYLPDWDHSQADVANTVVEMALDWARDRKLDGMRVDAAKHMSKAVLFNLRSTLDDHLTPPGSNFEFILIGETFDGAEAINAAIGPHLLHGQFDFPLYWTIRDAFVYDTASVAAAVNQAATIADQYPGGQMSTFLGNLDVGRFLTDRHEGNMNVCPDGSIRQAGWPDDAEAFDRLRLAWTLLFTQPGMPMIYYGDEFGIPGYGDPDNRQPLWWHGIDTTAGSVAAVAADLSAGPARVVDTLQRLIAARAAHPALQQGEQQNFWVDGDGLVGTVHSTDDDAAIVILNRNDTEAAIDNSLAFFGLPEGTWVDLLSDERFTSDGDRLRFSVPPTTPRVLVREP